METKELSVNVTEEELRSMLLLIRLRQDEIRRIPNDAPTFAKYRLVDIVLERFKNKLSKQLV